MSAGRMAGSVAVVTGGTSGIGLAIARRMIEEGARAVIVTGRDPRRGDKAVDELGGRARYVCHDATDEAGWDTLCRTTVTEFDRLDVLVNNAGQSGDGAPQDPVRTSLALWHEIMAANVDSTFLGCRAAIAIMRERGGGSIVNMSSTAGLMSTPAFVAYGAAKAAVAHLTRSVAVYCARQGTAIRCNSVHPAVIDTPLGEQILTLFDEDLERARSAYLSRVPMGTLGRPDDVADAVLYLACAESRYVTGTQLVVAGGLGS